MKKICKKQMLTKTTLLIIIQYYIKNKQNYLNDKFNIDQESLNKLNNMMKNGNVSELLSQIPPDVMQNFSSMMNNQNDNSGNSNNNEQNSSTSTQNSFDFSNIDMNTIIKIKNIIEKMNTTNDPRSNLLASLKPYLRDSKKNKLDEYANLINLAKIADILKNDNKESK